MTGKLPFFSALALIALATGCESGGSQSTVMTVHEDDGIPCSPDVSDSGSVDPLTWLKSADQAKLAEIFRCAPAAKQVPNGLGVGEGTVYQALPLFNDLQTRVGAGIWGGKRFYQQGDGQTCLLNEMNDSGTERYMAHVYLQDSPSDSKTSVVLDYRVDHTASASLPSTPAQIIVDQIVHGIRDEIREVTQNGVGTGVYVGRAMIHTASFLPNLNIFQPSDNPNLADISDADFINPSLYILGANFFLDFRAASQATLTPYGSATPTCASAP